MVIFGWTGQLIDKTIPVTFSEGNVLNICIPPRCQRVSWAERE